MCQNSSTKKGDNLVASFVELLSPCTDVFESQFPLKVSAVIHAQLRWKLMQTLGCLH